MAKREMPIKCKATTMEIRLYGLLISTANQRMEMNILQGNMIYQLAQNYAGSRNYSREWGAVRRGSTATAYIIHCKMRTNDSPTTPDGVQIAEASKSETASAASLDEILWSCC